jgi:hypothetical protein
MMPRNEGTLYEAIEVALRHHKKPVSCVDLYKLPAINLLAESSNRVSDYLGNMWRRGQLLRYPSDSGTSSARWTYSWKGDTRKRSADPIELSKPLKRAGPIEIVEGANEVFINLPECQIIFRPRAR